VTGRASHGASWPGVCQRGQMESPGRIRGVGGRPLLVVTVGPMPAIQVLRAASEDVDGRVEPASVRVDWAALSIGRPGRWSFVRLAEDELFRASPPPHPSSPPPTGRRGALRRSHESPWRPSGRIGVLRRRHGSPLRPSGRRGRVRWGLKARTGNLCGKPRRNDEGAPIGVANLHLAIALCRASAAPRPTRVKAADRRHDNSGHEGSHISLADGAP
jgi:hypothetical protein